MRNAIIEALVGSVLSGGRGGYGRYRIGTLVARAILDHLTAPAPVPPTMDRKEFARRLKAAGGDLRKIR